MDFVIDILVIADQLGCQDLLTRTKIILRENVNRISSRNRAKLIQSDPELNVRMFEYASLP